jgi:predicted phage-related endonuclease
MKLYKRESYKTKSEWLNARGIGGSSAAAICNKSKWLTANDVYNELALKKRKKVVENERMIEGVQSESAIRLLFSLDYKDEYKVINPPSRAYWLFRRTDKEYITCTPDGLLVDLKTGKLGGLEIKNVEMIKRDIRSLWENNTLPDQYYFQCLHYFVAKPDIEFVCLFAHLKYFIHDDKNDKWVFDHAVDKPYWIYKQDVISHIEFLEKKETEFYENNIRAKRRPKIVISF